MLTFGRNLAQDNKKDSINIKADSVNKSEKNILEDILEYKAQEIRNNFPEKKSYLIDKAQVKYQDLNILADYIYIDWNSGEVYGRGKTDSQGKIIETVLFEQGGKKYDYNEFKFNFKTKKGQAFSIRTEEGEGVIIAKKAKKANDSIMYLRHMKYTTDSYFKQKKDSVADYYLKAGKAKYINGKTLVTGPISMEIEGVQTPFVLPFFFLPKMSEKRSAGILIPSYGERESEGFYLQGLGYYMPIGEYFDLTLKTDIYTKGSWRIDASSKYKKNYKYSGNFNIDYSYRITGIKGLDNYSKGTIYNITWSHLQDSKSNPNLTFNSSLNFMSSQFYQSGLNNNNIFNGNVLNNTAQSSIAIQKNFVNTPFRASLSLNHSQNNQQKTYNFSLPQLNIYMDRIYPFAPKGKNKKGLIQNVNLNYNINSQSSYNNIAEADIFKSRMFNQANTGFNGQATISTNQTIFNYFNLTFGANHKTVGVTKTIRKYFDNQQDKDITNTINGIKLFQEFGFNTSVSTQVFGLMQFKKGSKIEAIRHVLSPSISYNLTPDFSEPSWGYYGTYTNKEGKPIKYSYFEGSVYGSPSANFSSSIGIGLNNNLEMKVRSGKNDSVDVKKIKFFESLSFNTAYNIAADSMRFSPISISGSTSFFNSKLRISYSGILNPYKIRNIVRNGVSSRDRIDKFGGLDLTSYSFSTGYNLDPTTFSKDKKKASQKYKRQGSVRNDVFYFDDDNYAHFDYEWRLNLGLNYSFTENLNGEDSKNASLAISGEVSPSPYWKISGNTSYDLVSKQLSLTTLTLSRDIRSFNINFSWVPFGPNRTWNFLIGIKSAILQDALKYKEQNFRTPNNF